MCCTPSPRNRACGRVDAAIREQGSKTDASAIRYIRTKAEIAELAKLFLGAVGNRGTFQRPKKITCEHHRCELKYKGPCESKPRVTRLCYRFVLVDLSYRHCQATEREY